MELEQGSAEASGPGGWRVRFTGIDTKIVLLALLITICLGLAVFGYYDSRRVDDDARQQYLAQHKATQAMLGSVITNQKAIIDLIHEGQRVSASDANEMIYVLSLDQKKRDALKLEMPPSLRRKMNDR